MATLCLQQLCLLLLLASGFLALDCDRTAESQLRVTNPEVREFIEAIGGQQLPHECLYKIPTFAFPEVKIFRASKEDRSVAVKIILEKTLEIFEHNFTRAGWDARITDRLQNALYRKSEEWKNCSITETGEVAILKNRDLYLTLRRYFRQIQTFLEGQQYSLCAWSVVRVEISWLFLDYLDKLLNRF